MKRLVFSFLLTFPLLAIAQNDLSADLPFFRERANVYERWLEHAGLGKVLKVQTVDLLTENAVDTLSLYLSFYSENTDIVVAAWEQLKRDFEARSPLTLEQQLFYKMTELMELEQERCYLQLYDTYDLAKTSCFFVGVYFEGDSVKVANNACKSEIKDVFIPANDLSGMKDPAESDLHGLDFDARRELFESILRFSRKRFKVGEAAGENDCNTRPALRVREKEERLRFEADNLCRHVLYDETNNLVCRIYTRLLGRECSTIKRESLSFTFTLGEAPTAGLIKLTCEIDGKFSDNWFSTGRGAYESMEGEFDEYLELFADTFTVELGEWLTNR